MTNAVPEVGMVSRCTYYPENNNKSKIQMYIKNIRFHDDRIILSNNMEFKYKNIAGYKMNNTMLIMTYVVGKVPSAVVFEFDEIKCVSQFHQIFTKKVNHLCELFKTTGRF
jgi:hypothetical protein